MDTRPTRDIYAIVGYNDEGAPIRVIDRAIEGYRTGASPGDIANLCGVARETVTEWVRRGTAVSADVYANRRRVADLSRHERKCFEFVQLTAQAEAEGKMFLLGLADQVAGGGYIVETITEKVDAEGKVIERTTKRQAAPLDGAMIRWRLATRWPDEFSRRTDVHVAGPDGGPVRLDATPIIDRLLGELDRMADNLHESDALIEAHAVETPALGPPADTSTSTSEPT